MTATPRDLADVFGLLDVEDFPPRYNIAPTQPILVVAAADRAAPGSNLPERKALLLRWGFIPSWADDPRDFPRLINARSETANEKASFKPAMRHRRVLVPASGFYEWHRPPKDSGEPAQPYWIRPKGGGLVAFGGLMETWSSADGSQMDTAAILTTSANAALSAIHPRMPVVIQPQDFARWLDCRAQEPRDVADLMKPDGETLFKTVPVSGLVNKVSNMGAELQTPIVAPKATPAAKSEEKARPMGGQLSLF